MLKPPELFEQSDMAPMRVAGREKGLRLGVFKGQLEAIAGFEGFSI